MSKVPGTVGFTQPTHGSGKTTTAKNKSKVGFVQPNQGKGKTSAAKNKTNVPFSQPNHGSTKASTKKNPGTVGFVQPNPAKKSTSMPKYEGKNIGKGANFKPAGKVAPSTGKFKSTDDLVSYRKKKYGI